MRPNKQCNLNTRISLSSKRSPRGNYDASHALHLHNLSQLRTGQRWNWTTRKTGGKGYACITKQTAKTSSALCGRSGDGTFTYGNMVAQKQPHYHHTGPMGHGWTIQRNTSAGPLNQPQRNSNSQPTREFQSHGSAHILFEVVASTHCPSAGTPTPRFRKWAGGAGQLSRNI